MKLGDPPKTHENLDEKWYECYLCGGAHTAATDLLTNGDFTSATTGWTAGNSASLSSTTGGTFSSNCLTITEAGVDTPQAYQTVTVVAETGHKIDYWEKRGTAYKYRVRVYDATNGADITSTAWKDGSEDWAGHTIRFVTPASCVSATVYLEHNGISGDTTTFQFDRVYLYGDHGESAPQYPESMTILATEDGHRYCLDHYHWRFHHKAIDDTEIEISDDLE